MLPCYRGFISPWTHFTNWPFQPSPRPGPTCNLPISRPVIFRSFLCFLSFSFNAFGRKLHIRICLNWMPTSAVSFSKALVMARGMAASSSAASVLCEGWASTSLQFLASLSSSRAPTVARSTLATVRKALMVSSHLAIHSSKWVLCLNLRDSGARRRD